MATLVFFSQVHQCPEANKCLLEQLSSIASSILAAGQVGPDWLLLTLIDPWSFLLKRLDSNKTHLKVVSSIASLILAAGQVGPDWLL